MGYFSNGSEGDAYEEQYCSRCVHDGGPEYKDGGCAVWLLHLKHNYNECNNKTSMLHQLIPRDGEGHNEQCRMFYPK